MTQLTCAHGGHKSSLWKGTWCFLITEFSKNSFWLPSSSTMITRFFCHMRSRQHACGMTLCTRDGGNVQRSVHRNYASKSHFSVVNAVFSPHNRNAALLYIHTFMVCVLWLN